MEAERSRVGTVFHPTILPPRTWLQQALLYTDQVAVISPDAGRRFDDFIINRYSRVGDDISVTPEAVELLVSGSLIPVSAEEIYYQHPELPERVIEELERHPNLQGSPDAKMFAGKFMHSIVDYLEERGLLERRTGDDLFQTKRPVLETTLSLMASAAAAQLNQEASEYRYGTCTTSAQALRTVTGLDSSAAKQALSVNAIHITLPDLPSPSSRASLREIIAFREDTENRIALERLRTHVTDGLREKLVGAVDLADFEFRLHQFRKSLSEEVAEINERLQDAGVAHKRIRRTIVAPAAEVVGAALMGALAAVATQTVGFAADVSADGFSTGIAKFFEVAITKMAAFRTANQEHPWAYLDVTDRRVKRLLTP